MSKNQGQRKNILKALREKRHFYLKGENNQNDSVLSSRNYGGQKKLTKYFSSANTKEPSTQNSIYLRNQGEIKTSSDKEDLLLIDLH